ncbi:sugar-binding protein [Polaribacter sp. NJDZ03]|uniref:sugar-binding protein n=1 Tax=Polaribacter sp. NJDZ03 TaxID=2855841 RepID=UPI001C4A66DF|nr:sugar-binding protein [Polaribacter sp. NJDZ03]
MKQFVIYKLKEGESRDDLTVLDDFFYPWEKETSPKTLFSAFYDDAYINFRFEAFGPKPKVFVATDNKLEVTKSERVEIFFRKNKEMTPYYCLEMDPNGRVLDYEANTYRKFNRKWMWPTSLCIKTVIKEDRYILEGKLSLSFLKEKEILKENQLEIGLYRGHCVELVNDIATIKWISWVDPKTEKPDFHVAESFGVLKLE